MRFAGRLVATVLYLSFVLSGLDYATYPGGSDSIRLPAWAGTQTEMYVSDHTRSLDFPLTSGSRAPTGFF